MSDIPGTPVNTFPPPLPTPPVTDLKQAEQKADELLEELDRTQPGGGGRKWGQFLKVGGALLVVVVIGVGVVLGVRRTTNLATTTDPRVKADQCEAGTPHIYTECCAPGKSKRVQRTCVGGSFQWQNLIGCELDDSACGPAGPGEECGPGTTFFNGECRQLGVCQPSCVGKACGESDGCGGPCTENCPQEQENLPPIPPADGGTHNSGDVNTNACNNSTGVCTAGAGQVVLACKCTAWDSRGWCTENCSQVGTASCQALADESCRLVQLDVVSATDPSPTGNIIDTFSCYPNPSKCGVGGNGGPPPSEPPGPSSLSCSGLGSSPETPALGQSLTLTCRAPGTQTVDHFEFRYRVDSGAWTSLAAGTAQSSGGNYIGTSQLTASQAGAYNAQCRVCRDAGATQCTNWGVDR